MSTKGFGESREVDAFADDEVQVDESLVVAYLSQFFRDVASGIAETTPWKCEDRLVSELELPALRDG